ncbi:MAG: hypothetical protein ACXAEN_22765 [Candidatus Thorarchaeota archaeon]|jgi:hypothetical protein
MASITQQKASIKEILREIVMDRYDIEDAEGQRAIANGLLRQLMAKMTLGELRDWHHGIAITKYVRDQIEEAKK